MNETNTMILNAYNLLNEMVLNERFLLTEEAVTKNPLEWIVQNYTTIQAEMLAAHQMIASVLNA